MEEQSTTVHGCCPLDCQDSCAWTAQVQGGRVLRLEGRKDHPFTRGALCAKVHDYPLRVEAPDRLLQPLRRIGKKGSGEFVPISRDAALELVATQLLGIVDRYGGEALLPLNYLGSMGVVQRRALMRVFHALGAWRFYGSVCGASGNVLEEEGHPRGFDPEEIVNSRFVLLWGCNMLTTSHHHWHFLKVARERHGTRIICIDPIRTRTARAADEHVALRPGSDQVLAAAFGRLMLHEGWVDRASAARVVKDLDAYAASVESWTPERAAGVTGVDAAVICRLAREFAAARPALIRCGIAPQQTQRGEAFVRSLSALAILGGHWGTTGGGLFIEAFPLLNEAAAARADLQPQPTRELDIARLGELLEDAALDPPIKGLVLWGMNPAVTQPDAARVQRGLARDDLFTVVVEHFMTDTARYADVVLPSTTQLEHFDVQGAWGHHYITLNEPALSPRGEALSHGEIMRRLARQLGLTHPALSETDEQIGASALPEGITLDDLRVRGWLKMGPPRPTLERRKLQIAEDVVAPTARGPGMLQLLTPKSHYFLNSTFANMKRQRHANGLPTLSIHPDDAAHAGLGDEVEVEIYNNLGTLHARAAITDDIVRGVVSLPGKWWHPVPAGESGAVSNLLCGSDWSPGGQPAYNEVFVEVRRAKPVGAATVLL